MGDGEHLLLDVELPDVETAGAVEAEEEGVVRGHIAALASRGGGPGHVSEAAPDVS